MSYSNLAIIGPQRHFDCHICGVHQSFQLDRGECCPTCDKEKRKADCYLDGHKPGNPIQIPGSDLLTTFCTHCLSAVSTTDHDGTEKGHATDV